MSDIKIKDNFLDQKDFEEIQTLIFGRDFSWKYGESIDYQDEEGDKFQFAHLFYGARCPTSNHLVVLNPIFDKIQPTAIWRIKANLLTRTPEIVENSLHIDNAELSHSEEKLHQWTTSIFYMNTNNGYTKFEDGTIIESIENRMIIFPSAMKHTGTSCTDERVRIVINFNYFAP